MNTTDMIKIDGSQGEGGGQILRTSLSLAMATGQAFTIENIRAGRARPGLMRQHLACVKAAAEVCGGTVDGAELGSQRLVFEPGSVRAGDYHFTIGSAGSTTLVAQTVLPVLMTADSPSVLSFDGGTHNTKCPTIDFLEASFLPQLAHMGVKTEISLGRRGFYPAGGGQWALAITPTAKLEPLDLSERGACRAVTAEAIVAGLGRSIAVRELKVLAKKFELAPEHWSVTEDAAAHGPGNVVALRAEHEHVTNIFTGFGKLGVSAESIAKSVGKGGNAFLNSTAAVGPYLADQLLLPMALAGGGRFTTLRPSRHTLTNIETIQRFLPIGIDLTEGDHGVWTVTVKIDA